MMRDIFLNWLQWLRIFQDETNEIYKVNRQSSFKSIDRYLDISLTIDEIYFSSKPKNHRYDEHIHTYYTNIMLIFIKTVL